MARRLINEAERQRQAPITGRAWADVLGPILREIGKRAPGGVYDGNMSRLIDKIREEQEIAHSASSIMARLQMGGWLTYDGKSGGTPTWQVKDEHVTVDDASRADFLHRKEVKARNSAPRRPKPQPDTDIRPDGGATTNAMPAMLVRGADEVGRKEEREGQRALDRSRPDPHAECARRLRQANDLAAEKQRRIDLLATQLAKGSLPTDAVAREVYDKDIADLRERLDERDAVIRALMVDSKTAELLRIATRVFRGESP